MNNLLVFIILNIYIKIKHIIKIINNFNLYNFLKYT